MAVKMTVCNRVLTVAVLISIYWTCVESRCLINCTTGDACDSDDNADEGYVLGVTYILYKPTIAV